MGSSDKKVKKKVKVSDWVSLLIFWLLPLVPFWSKGMKQGFLKQFIIKRECNASSRVCLFTSDGIPMWPLPMMSLVSYRSHGTPNLFKLLDLKTHPAPNSSTWVAACPNRLIYRLIILNWLTQHTTWCWFGFHNRIAITNLEHFWPHFLLEHSRFKIYCIFHFWPITR